MRIRYVVTYGLPSRAANSVQAMKMAQAFGQEGHDIKVLAPSGPDDAPSPDALRELYGLTAPAPIETLARAHVLRGHDFAARCALRARREADVAYSRNLAASLWIALAGVPTIHEQHTSLAGRLGPSYFAALLRLRSLVRVVSISHALEAHLRERFGDQLARRVVVAPDGVDLERFEGLPAAVDAKRELGLPVDAFVAGYAGHLYEGRGIDLILATAERLPSTRFLLMGGYDDAVAAARRDAVSRGLANVTFTGFVPNAILPRRLAACDVLLMPYQRRALTVSGTDIASWMSPMKMFEYLAAARPILSSDLPVLREVLNEDNAVLLDPERPDEWARAIAALLNEPERARRLADRGGADARRYSWRARAATVLAGLPPARRVHRDHS